MDEQKLTQDPPSNQGVDKASAKANFEEQKQKLVNNQDFIKLDDKKKQLALSMFFDKYGVDLIKQSGVQDEEAIKRLKVRWTGETYNEIKGITPEPPKPEEVTPGTEKKSKVERKPDPTVLPEWLDDGASIYQEVTQPVDKLQSAPLRDPEKEASVKAHYEQLQTEIPSVTEKLLSDNEFGYIKSRPELYLRGGEQTVKDVDKWLKKNTDLAYYDRNYVQEYLAQKSNDEMVKNLREKHTGDLNLEMEEKAQPFIEEFEDGSFLDPITDERVKEPQTVEDTEFLSMIDKTQNDLLAMMLTADTKNPLSIERDAIDEEYAALEEEGNALNELANQEVGWLRGMTYRSVEHILEQGKDMNFVKRILDPTTVPSLDRGEGVTSTHSMAYGEADGKYYVYPTVVEKDGKLVDLEAEGIDPFKYAIENKEAIVFETEEEAKLFSGDAGYKQYWYEKGFLERPKDMPEIPEAETDEEYMQNYSDWITKVNQGNAEYSKKVEQYNERTQDFHEKIKDLPKEAVTKKTLRDRLTDAVQDSYLKWQHYEQQFESAKRQYEGTEETLKAPSIKSMDQLNKLRYQAKAEFVAGSRMLYNQEGPLDIERGQEYQDELFLTSLTRNVGPGKVAEKLSYWDEPRQQEILGAMYKVGQAAGIQFTDEELDAFNATVLENMVTGFGGLAPKLPELLLLGQAAGVVKGALNLRKFAKGYQIIKNEALGKAMVIGADEVAGQGWKVARVFKPTTFQKVAGTVASGMIDEAIFTAGGFEFGAITGMNAAHQVMPDLKFKGRLQMFNPIMDMFYKSGVGATVGMEAGASAAGLVEAALTDRPIDDIFHEMFPGVSETGKRILEEFVINTMLFGGQGAIMKSISKAKSAPAGMQFNRFGNANWTGYIDPRVRDRYRQAAKEFEARGFTDTATEIYQWLDIYDGPLKSQVIKEGRMENLEKSLEPLPDGMLREARDVYQLMIKVLEYQGRQPDFTGTIEAPIRTYDDVREGSVINTRDHVPTEGKVEGDPKWETVTNHWEIIKRENAPNGAPVRYEGIHTATGEKRVFEIKTTETEDGKTSYFEFDPTISIKLQNSLQVPFMLEAGYEHYNVLNKILAGRNIDPKILPPGPTGPQAPPGVDISPPPKRTKIERKREELALREKNMVDETGAEPIAIEPPAKEYSFGDPEKILETPAREFSEKMSGRVEEQSGQLKSLRASIEEMQIKFDTPFPGRPTNVDRENKEQLGNDIQRAQIAVDKMTNEFDSELREWLDLAKPQLSTAITDISPGTKPEEIDAILDNLWDSMTKPTEEEADMTIGELLKKSMGDKPATEEPPAAPPADKEKVDRERKHDLLLSMVNEYNEIKNKKSKRAKSLWPMISRGVPELGYTFGMEGKDPRNQKIVVLGEDGKPISMTPMYTPKEEIEAHPLLTEYEDPDFIDFVNRIIEAPENLMSYDVPLKASEIEQAVRNIKEGKKTVAANKLLDALEKSMEDGVIVLKGTRRTPREEIPIDEFNALVNESNFQNFTKKYGKLDPDNIDEAVKLGLMTEEEKNQFLKNLEDEIKKEAESEADPGPEPDEERPVDTEGEGAGKGEVKAGDRVVLPEGYISLAAGTEGKVTRIFEQDGEPHAALDLGENLSGKKLKRDVPLTYLEKVEEKPVENLKEADRVTQEINDKITDKLEEIKRVQAAKEKMYVELTGRKGFFGDTGEEGMFEDTFDPTDENMKKALEPFDAQIAKLEKEIAKLEKSRDTAAKEAAGQGKMVFDTSDVTKDLDDMLGLLDDMDIDIGPVEAAGGTASEDPQIKMLTIATGLVKKLTDAGTFGFDEILKKIIPSIPMHKLKVLLPFIKQGYMAHMAVATPEVQGLMDAQRVMSFGFSDLEKLIPKEEPVEEVIPREIRTFKKGDSVHPPDTDETVFVIMTVGSKRVIVMVHTISGHPYKTTLPSEQLVVPMYPEKPSAPPVEAPKKPVKPPVPTEDEKRKQDIIDSKIMETPTEYLYVSMTEVFKMVDDMVKRGEPLRDYIEQYVPNDLLEKAVELYNEIAQLYARLGYKGVHDVPNFLPINISPDLIVTPLYHVGINGRNFDRGEDNGYYTKVQAAIDNLSSKVSEGSKELAIAKQLALTMDIKYHIWNGLQFEKEGYAGITELANNIWGVHNKADVRDSFEQALVEIARTMAQDPSKSVETQFSNILNLYKTTPNIPIDARTVTVKVMQQYSTPVPIAFLMGEYVNGKDVDLILEPQSGIGSLLINTRKGGVRANELDPKRLSKLANQGYRTFNKDSSHGLKEVFGGDHFHAILMNPPFGGQTEDYHGYPLAGEYVSVAYNLESMVDYGKAAIIVGGGLYGLEFSGGGIKGGQDLVFYNWLSKHYNVEDIIQLDGSLYRGMGTAYPTVLILVNGRKAAPQGAAPEQSVNDYTPIKEWSDLRDRILSKKTKPHEKSILQAKLDAERGNDSIMDGEGPTTPSDTGSPGVTGIRGEEDIVPGATGVTGGGEKPVEKPVGGDTGKWGPGPGGTDTGSSGIPKPTGGIKPQGDGGGGGKFGQVTTPTGATVTPSGDTGKPTERTKRELKERSSDTVAPYTSLSRMGGQEFVVPSDLEPYINGALKQLHAEIGDVDDFVMKYLKYNSKEDMRDALFGAQVDGIAQAIYNIEAGEAMIIGHQTGAGKGRIASGVASYAIENGKVPVYITKGANLFTDIWRDFAGIGRPDYQPFIMNKQFPDTGQKVRIFDIETGAILHEVNASEIEEIVGKGKTDGTFMIPEGTDMIFTTYSQFANEENAMPKRNFLMDLARKKDVVFIMDESHGAAGMSKTGQFFMDWIQETKGGIFLSATYAKRPDNMPLYAMKTVMREANMSLEALIEAIQAGGPALQEIITTQLAEAGQFSKVGMQLDATINYHILGDTDPTMKTYDPKLGEELVRRYDAVTEVLREIVHFQKVYINPILKGMDEAIKKEGKVVGTRKGTKEAGIANSPYFSKIWNIIDQLLFSLKSESMLPLILEDLANGIKPVITFRNTMEAVFKEMAANGDLKKGDIIDMDFAYILKRGMNTIMKYTETDEQGTDVKKVLAPEDMDGITRSKYFDLMEMISNTATGIPLSPIDVLRKGVADAGYKSIEITGREGMFELSDDGKTGKWVRNDKGDRIKAVWNFNNNPGYAAFMNASGDTGLSLHPLAQNLDHSPSSMFPAQMNLDINGVVQMFGRIGRVGQLHKPTYNIISTSLPAENRMFMMMAKKLKSLDANTSGNQKQSSNMLDVPDFLNKYGDGVVIEFLKENPDINEEIGDPFKIAGADDKDIDATDAAHKATGRIQILPSEVQKYFNDEVLDRYEQSIAYLDATGTNDLMVTNEDLKAKELATEKVIEGRGGFSKFAADTNLRTYEVDVINKPLTKVQVDAELAKVPENHQTDTINAMEKGLQERLEGIIQKAQDRMDESKESTRKRIFDKKSMSLDDKQREWDLKEAEIDKIYNYQVEGAQGDIDVLRNRYSRAMSFFEPGRVVDLPFATNDAAEITRMNQGLFLSFDINMKKSNPWVPSNIMLRFATLDSRKMFRIPLSKEAHVEMIMRLSTNIPQFEQQDVLENWDLKKKGRGREKRYIVTENVVQGAYQYSKGRLINFTLEDGTIKEGILMPETWKKPDVSIYQIPITKAINIIRKLRPGKFVEDYSGDILIKRLPFSDYSPESFELRVPASKMRGHKYYTNKQLTDLMSVEWEQRGDRMVAEFPEDRLEAVLDILDQRFKTVLEVDGADVREGHDSTESEAMAAEYSTGPRTKPKDRKGLSDPYQVEPIGGKSHPFGERIHPEPIHGEVPKDLDKIIFDIGKSLGGKDVAFHPRPGGKQRAAGAHYPLTNYIAIKFRTDLNTTAHEIGHYLDKLFGILGPEAYNVMDDLREDLQHLWEHSMTKSSLAKADDQKKMVEGLAEFFRALIVAPAETKRRFPNTYLWVKGRVSRNQKVWEGLEEFSRDIRVYYGSTNLDKVGATMDLDLKDPKKNPLVFSRTNREGLYQSTLFDKMGNRVWFLYESGVIAWKWAMRLQGIEPDNPKQVDPLVNFEYLVRNQLGFDVKINNIDEHGFIDFRTNRIIDEVSGEPLSWDLWLRSIPSHDWREVDQNLRFALKVMAAYRGKEIPGKLAAKQARMDLSANIDKIPPLEILEMEHQGYNRRIFEGKIAKVLKMLLDGDLDEEKAFWPKERYLRFRENTLIGAAQEGMTDYGIVSGAVDEFEALEKSDPEKFKWVSEFMRVGHAIGKWYNDYALEAGLITDKIHAQVEEENLYYVMMRRALAYSAAASVEGTDFHLDPYTESGDEIPTIVMPGIIGSEMKIKHPFGSMIGAVHSLIKMADTNYVIMSFAQAFTGTLNPDPLMTPTNLGELAVVKEVYDPLGIHFKFKGKDRWLVIRDKEVAMTFKTLVKEDNGILNLLSAIPRTLQRSIVTAIQFMLRNTPRDIGGYLIYGKDQSLKNIFKDLNFSRERMDMLELSGGAQFGLVIQGRRGYNKLLRDLMLDASKDPKKFLYNPWSYVRRTRDKFVYAAGMSERITRMLQLNASFRKSKAEGMGNASAATKAAFNARDLTDFQAAGTWVKEMNKWIIFSGAAVRGLEKVARETRKNPKRMAKRFTLYSVLPSIMVPVLVAAFADDEQKERYLNLPDYLRDMFYMIPMGDGWLMIPKPFELGAISSAAQRLVDMVILGDKNAFSINYLKSFGHLINPYDLAGVMGGFGGLVGAIGNYDYFRQRYIIPPAEKNLAVVKRNTEIASKFGQDLQRLSGWDARLIDSYVKGQFAYWGDIFIKTYEAARNIGSGEKIRRRWKFDAEDLSLYKRDQVFGTPNVVWLLQKEKLYPDEIKFITKGGFDFFQDMLYNYMGDEVQNNQKERMSQGARVRGEAAYIHEGIDAYLKENNTTLDKMAIELKEYKKWLKTK